MRTLPRIVSQLVTHHDAWVVGSAAQPTLTDLSSVKDFDVVVPLVRWSQAALLVPRDARPNTFGGWKCESEGRFVDVWPADLVELMQQRMMEHLWHPKTGARFTRWGLK